MNEKELAKKYVPRLFFNRNEPFLPKKIFYKVYSNAINIVSNTSKYKFIFPPNSKYVIEYAIYYTYDIQHLYDLEHVFVYVDENEKINKVVSSFHGKFYNSLIPNNNVLEDPQHPKLFVQPGKHALMPKVELFNLFEQFDTCCKEDCGIAGFLIYNLFDDVFKKDITFDLKVEKYIRKMFTFDYAPQYERKVVEEQLLLSNKHFKPYIVDDLNKEIKNINFML